MLLTFKLREISCRSRDRALALEVSRHPALPCDDITFAVDYNNSLQCRRGNMLKVPSPKPPHGSRSLDQRKQAGSHLPRQFPGVRVFGRSREYSSHHPRPRRVLHTACCLHPYAVAFLLSQESEEESAPLPSYPEFKFRLHTPGTYLKQEGEPYLNNSLRGMTRNLGAGIPPSLPRRRSRGLCKESLEKSWKTSTPSIGGLLGKPPCPLPVCSS